MLWKTAGPFSGEEAQGSSGYQQQSRGNFTAVVSVGVLRCCHGLGAVARMQL